MGLFNIVWFIFIGWWSSLAWLIIAIHFAITIIGIPIAKSCLEFAKLNAFPYGKEIIKETELKGESEVSSLRKIGGLVLNIIWFPIGVLASFSYLVFGLFSFVTVIGIPVGVVMIRMAKFVLFPIGAKVVTQKQAYASAVANEIAKRSNM